MIKFTKFHPRFDSLHLVARAVAKKDARFWLKYIYVDDESIVATDGHRMHITKNLAGDKLEPGFYEILKLTKTMVWIGKTNVDAIYPDYRQPLKQESPTKSAFQVPFGPAGIALAYHAMLSLSAATTGDMICVRHDYFASAARHNWNTISMTDKYGCVILSNEADTALLMPMKT